MAASEESHRAEPRLFSTLRDDLRRTDVEGTLREFKQLKEFFVSEARRQELQSMSPFRRWVLTVWWTFTGMILKLTPTRRLILVLGLVLLLIGQTVQIEGHNVSVRNWHILGGALIFIVLMLELKDRILAKDELEAGRLVQRALMPPRSPAVPGWNVWLFTRPANEVGGDLVDYIDIAPDRKAVVVGDVAGKGLRAALLMANLQATVRALAPDLTSIDVLLTRTNRVFHRNTIPGLFASILYIEILPGTGTLRYANAGHLPPALLRLGGCEQMAKGEVALGLMADSAAVERSITLVRGETFVGFSDGVTEAQNATGEFFGVERLMALLPTLRGRTAQEIGEAITHAVEAFVGQAPASDDLSLVVLQRV
jgi:phosphoserine phosphatase RsbU/P